MGLFKKLFSSRVTTGPATAGDGAPWTALSDGHLVIQARECFPITGRGVIMTGEALVPIAVDQWCAVTGGGDSRQMRISTITPEGDDRPLPSAAPGMSVTVMFSLPPKGGGSWT
ncbi:hypothetical protein HQ32_02892 [Prauserella sp. Am3]|nr:hypothetical protein HQ32_02892 [Prauserella sp. Am3]